MAKLAWDVVGERVFETGVDRGVLYIPNAGGIYDTGYAWNGLTAVTESRSGAEANPQYADNIKYLNLISAEEFGATIEAFTYPLAFEQCDGTVSVSTGVSIGQQTRKSFGLAYRSRVGNDIQGVDYGYKIHLIYGALAAPTEKAYATINESPEAITFSWEVTTTPVDVPGFKPTAQFTIDSTKVGASALASLEDALYGTAGTNPRLPTPAEIIAMFAGSLTTTAMPTAPTYNATTDQITFPSITGVEYYVDGVKRTTPLTITKDTIVRAQPAVGYKFPANADDDWLIVFS